MEQATPVPAFQPDFSRGLLPAIVQDEKNGLVLMLAWLNAEAWQKSLETGETHFWSRSRQKLWHKGESSGNVQKIKAIRLDCDNDTILFLVEQVGGAACHTGHKSCFFRELREGQVRGCSDRVFDPDKVYGNS